MADDIISAFLLAEAGNDNTPTARLKELAHYASLHPLLAANPATPANTLEQLSVADDPAIRRAVTLHPNTPITVLCDLAAEFPEEFLHNPILPTLTMTQPDFIKELPLTSWASLLRFANLSPAWFQLIKDEKSYQRNRPAIWELMQLHVSLANETGKNLSPASWNVQHLYQQQLPEPLPLAPEKDVELFLRFVMLLPYTAPMLKKQWIAAAQISPRRVGIALSLLREIGPRTTGQIALGDNPFVLSQMARHPATPPRILQHLVLDKRRLWSSTKARPVVQHAIASNPHTPLAAIYQLVSAAKTGLRSRAATHPALEGLDHEIIALDAETSVRASLATLPRLAPHLFAQLATDPAPTVRASLARNLRVPLDILRDLSHDVEPVVRAAAAGNPRLPVEVQAALLNDHAGSVRASLSGNARLHTDHALVLAQDPSPRVRAYLAANPRTPVALLSMLLEAQEPEIWRGLARHPKTPPDMLTQLAQRGDQRTRIAVAAHTRTPVEILAELAQKNTHAIWCALASNPQTPLHVLEPALRTYSLDLLHRLINHPAMRREKHRPLLKLLATQVQSLIATNRLPDWLRRAFLQYTAALPVEITTLFATSPYWQERYLLACRPHLPTTVLQTLAQDGIYYVQAAARKALEQRQNPEQARRPHRKH